MAATEFALLLPLMLVLYLGGIEVSQAVGAQRKVTITAHTVADLVSRVTTIYSTDTANVAAAAGAVIAPYNDSNLSVTVSSVKIDAQGNATIDWSRTLYGSIAHSHGDAVAFTTKQAVLDVANSSLIWAEVQYNYRPVLGYVLTGTLTLSDQMFMAPRDSTSVNCGPGDNYTC